MRLYNDNCDDTQINLKLSMSILSKHIKKLSLSTKQKHIGSTLHYFLSTFIDSFSYLTFTESLQI